MQPRVMGIVLAGGAGTRLGPLTADRAKPAVPFGGLYRLIDFAVSNLVNADILRVYVLTQYKSQSLQRHITTTWPGGAFGGHVSVVPAQQRLGPHWYTGSADAIYQSLNLLFDERPDIVVVVSADHVYRMDPRQVIEQHLASGAGVTVVALPVPRADATGFGVIGVGKDDVSIESFVEKPADPPAMPGEPGLALASMGNYVFSTVTLVDALRQDAADTGSRHDVGGNLIPMLVADHSAQAHDFTGNRVPGGERKGAAYWRDVGTLDAYYDAHMELCAVDPTFDLYNVQWPILTHVPSWPPAKFTCEPGGPPGQALNSLVSNGVIVCSGLVRESVLSPGVRVSGGATVERSVVLDNTVISRGAVVRNAIIDKKVIVPDGAQIGCDKEYDRARGFVVTDAGVTVVGKYQEVPC
jgi:glucose-1-phosphate adenylyltransferase